MKTFKSIADVEHARHHPLHATIKELASTFMTESDYRPEDDGYLALLEREDVDRVLDDLDMPYRLSEVPFEGVSIIDGCFLAVYLPNNQFGLDFLIPDAEWLTGEARRHLEDHLDP